MSITAICEALIEAGATPLMIVAAVRADEQARCNNDEKRREKDRCRKVSERALALTYSHASTESTDSADKEKVLSPLSPFPPITPLTPTPQSPKEPIISTRKEVFVPPNWIPRQDWDDYLEMRVKAKKPATDAARKAAVVKLDRLRQKGHDPGGVLQQSTFHNWPGLYEIKENHGTTTQNHRKSFSGSHKQSVTDAAIDVFAAIKRGEI